MQVVCNEIGTYVNFLGRPRGKPAEDFKNIPGEGCCLPILGKVRVLDGVDVREQISFMNDSVQYKCLG
jgi:hypothetical protein